MAETKALKASSLLLDDKVLKAREERIRKIVEATIKKINEIIPERIIFVKNNQDIAAVIGVSELPYPQVLLRNKEILEKVISEYRGAGWVTMFNQRESTIDFNQVL